MAIQSGCINLSMLVVNSMISQNIGAGKQKRSRKVVYWAWGDSAALTVFFMVLYVCFGKQLFMIFSDDPLVHEMSRVFISAIWWMFPAFSVMRGSGAFIQGIDNARLCMVLAILDGVVLRIGLSWFFGIFLGWCFYSFVLGYGLAPYGYAIPSMLYFLSGRWQKRRLFGRGTMRNQRSILKMTPIYEKTGVDFLAFIVYTTL